MIKISDNYKKAFVEVEAVLNCLDENEYNKIPEDVINAIKLNKDEEYVYEYDESLDYEEWDLMVESKAILYNILEEYLVNDEQKQFFKEKEAFEIKKAEQLKVERYNQKDLFKRKEYENVKKVENTQIIEYKQNFIQKIFSKIKAIFKKK